ncbi:hypothetical protein [Granulibacter bethesdensis]|uniref:Uncharacterized protein n=1 Tax=Granulibacter bethesdensis (strain ATCC BAA-1260 / CGDNIH1) TaxID=391165 RepID=Q0BS87_GRABC|nr:hypothetical protein [Granulibacter bethesdensis]ABI62315.1 Hypothetical protein GbCGDNIH1_1417 [Granulibacter bethesdensis CGDNIH1]AHJ68770.1 Hypothetical protein GbCGDNIH2_1417 [Granulibacter bethesdensis]APH52142.1 Hypothetical protein GbCGDNIH5_1417 [Granulibacter bethesdensis]APH64835.1 Hypothetical protein GbCGDNIH1I4_1417 [Granulibacter bethesdensis]
MSDLFSPDGGWCVRILDLSAPEDAALEDRVVEEVSGFLTLMHANAFARRYVRDSLERCRETGMAPADVLAAWSAFGEDAEVVDGGEHGWSSAAEVGVFAREPAKGEDRDWRLLDPRRDTDDDDDDAEEGASSSASAAADDDNGQED